MITVAPFGKCHGGVVRFIGLGWTEHRFRARAGGGDKCWRHGCPVRFGDIHTPPKRVGFFGETEVDGNVTWVCFGGSDWSRRIERDE